jgi:hypothetical protein
MDSLFQPKQKLFSKCYNPDLCCYASVLLYVCLSVCLLCVLWTQILYSFRVPNPNNARPHSAVIAERDKWFEVSV